MYNTISKINHEIHQPTQLATPDLGYAQAKCVGIKCVKGRTSFPINLESCATEQHKNKLDSTILIFTGMFRTESVNIWAASIFREPIVNSYKFDNVNRSFGNVSFGNVFICMNMNLLSII